MIGGEPGDGGRDGNGADRTRFRWSVVAVGVLAAVAIVVGLVVVLTGDGGDDGDETASGTGDNRVTTTEPPDETTSTTTPSTTTTTAAVRAAIGVGGVFEVQLPSDWGSISVDGDMTGRGAEMFPDDPGHAEVADMVFDILLTPQTRFFAMDGSSPSSVTESDLLIVENGPAQVGLDTAFAAAKDATAATPLAEGHVATRAGEVAWFEFAGPAGLHGRRYVLVADGAVWLLTYWSGDTEHIAAAADEVVASLLPTVPI